MLAARLARLLLERGAHVDAVDANGWTALHWSVRSEEDARPAHADVIAALLEAHADAGAREAVLGLMRGAQDTNEPLCIHCADGHALTSIPLADWLLTDYIGGDNYEEACHALASRKRLAGVERQAEASMLEKWIVEGHL